MNITFYKNKIIDLFNNIDKKEYNIENYNIDDMREFNFMEDESGEDNDFNEIRVDIELKDDVIKLNNKRNIIENKNDNIILEKLTRIIKEYIIKNLNKDNNSNFKIDDKHNYEYYIKIMNSRNNDNVKEIIKFHINTVDFSLPRITIVLEKMVRIDDSIFITLDRYNEFEIYHNCIETTKRNFYTMIKEKEINNKIIKYINNLKTIQEKNEKLLKIIKGI